MKHIIYIIFILIGFQSLSAQGWHKFYDEYPSSIAHQIVQLPDNSYVIAGKMNPGLTDKLFLARIGKNGAILDVKTDLNIRMIDIGNLLWSPEEGLVLLGSKMNATQDLLVLKFNEELDLKWMTDLPSLGYKEEARDLILDRDGNCLIHGVSYKSVGFTPIFAKLDKDGLILWHKKGDDIKASSDMILNSEGNIVTTGRTLNHEKAFVNVYDRKTGNEIDFQLFDPETEEKETGFEIIRGDDNHLFIVSKFERYDPVSFDLFDSRLRLREIDSNGNVVFQKDLGRGQTIEEYIRIIRLEDGTFTYCFRSFENGNRYYIQIVHFDRDLETELWSKEYMDISPEIELAYDFISTHDGGYMVAGAIAADKFIPLLVKVDRNGVSFSNEIKGTVFHDKDRDCSYGAEEPNLAKWMVEIKNAEEVFYRLVDEEGNFSLFVDKNSYRVRAVPPSDAWVECPTVTVSFNDYFQEENVRVPAQPLFDCPVLSADISIGSLRRCYERNYTVKYCNLGTEDANNVYIVVEIDSDLEVTNASIPILSSEGNKLTFDIGNLPYNDCGTFLITVFTPCDVDFGDIHCSTVHIYPDDICEDALAWTGAKVKVVGECLENGVVSFEIKNIGQEDMTGELLFHVIEDEMVLMTGTFDLDIGESHPVVIPATGGVYRLEAEQIPDYPGESSPSVIVPGCGGFFDSDYVNWYPMDDDELFYDISCMENEDSYDPNDKKASPVGYGVEHYIERNTDIEYQIRFQNTGTGDAYEVEVVDAITDVLDISTFRMGVSSHPCNVQINSIEGKHVLRFIFNDINLPPLSVDEAKSSGFVKFTISQAPDLPIGTVIENNARIYFDFNEPIITNIARHTIGKDFIQIGVISGGIEEEHILKVTVSPNPLVEEAIVKWNGADGEAIFMDLYSADGKLMKRNRFVNNEVLVQRDDLAVGMYFFSIMTSNGEAHRGKMMIK